MENICTCNSRTVDETFSKVIHSANCPCYKKIKIELNEYYYDCSDGCCTNYGTVTKINGVELECHNQDVKTIVQQILEHLEYEVEIIETYNNE